MRMGRGYSLLSSSGVIGAATLLSRVLGLVRDALISALLLRSPAVADAFFVGFRIVSMFRELFAEGALSAAFVPTLSRQLKQGGAEAANRLAGAVLRLLLLTVAAATLIGIALAPWIARLFLLGWDDAADAAHVALAAGLLRAMFPYLLLISLAAVTMGMLNALLHFAVPALSPALLNVCIIAAIGLGVWLHPEREPATIAYWIAGGVVAGGAAQFGSQLIQARRLGYFKPLGGPLWHPETWPLLRLMGPRALGAAVTQLSILVNTFLVSFLAKGSMTALWNAGRLFQFPLGVLGITITTATFPKLSLDATDEDRGLFQRTLLTGLRAVLTVMLPATAGLIAISEPATAAVYNHLHFRSSGLLDVTRWALVAYALGLAGHSAAKLLAAAFFALHDTWTPLKVGAVSQVVNIVSSLVLMQFWGVVGLALGTSITGVAQMAILGGILRRRTGIGYAPLADPAWRMGLASALMGAAVWGTLRWCPDPAGGFGSAVLGCLAGMLVGGTVYVVLLRVLLPEEWARLRGIVARLRGRTETEP